MGKNFLNKGASRLLPILIVLVAATAGYFLWTIFGDQLGLKLPTEGLREIKIPTQEGQKVSPSPTSTLVGSPTPKPLKQGKETYSISQGTKVGPKITQVTLDPLDPKNGEKQTITVKTFDSSPITQVKISLLSDSKTQTLPPLSLVSGTNLDGEWQVIWTVNDTVLYKYVLTITATSASGQNSVELAIRL